MESNFTIRFHRNNGNLHLTVKGDFDGSSACVLFDALKKNCANKDRIVVHTGGLKQVHPFGQRVFGSKFAELKGKSEKIIFTGENAAGIALEGFQGLGD